MSNGKTSTLLATERAYRPAVLAVTYASCALVTLLLRMSWHSTPLVVWCTCAVLSVALEASNLYYRATHDNTTVGMIPIALFALVPALMLALLSGGLAPVAREVSAAALILLSALLIRFGFWAATIRSAYADQPAVEPDAALIVLGGAIRQGRPCQTLARRLDVAADLWHESNARTIVVTGGVLPDGSSTEADAMARYLDEAGVAARSIVLERTARNTYENIKLASKLLDERGHVGQRCVVSSDYHLWRARRDARMLGITLIPVAAHTPMPSGLQQWSREILTILAGR